MPYNKAEATQTIRVSAAPPIPWWLVGLGLGAVAIVIIVAATRKT
jgi:hypothetical protein